MPISQKIICANLPTLINLLSTTLAQTEKKSLLQPIIILIPSNEFSKLLKKNIAENPASKKICAGVEFAFPANFFWKVTQQLIPQVPAVSPFSVQNLSWIIWKILISNSPENNISELNNWIAQNNQLAIFQFAQKLARVFDNYRLNLSDMLLGWENGKVGNKPHELWQSQIWQKIINTLYPNSINSTAIDANQKFDNSSNPLYKWINEIINPNSILRNNYINILQKFYPNGIHWIGGIPLSQLAIQYQHSLDALSQAVDVVEWQWQAKIEENINLPFAEDLQKIYEPIVEEKYFNSQKKVLLITSPPNHSENQLANLQNYWSSAEAKITTSKTINDGSILFGGFSSITEEIKYWGDFLANKLSKGKYFAHEINIYAPNPDSYGGLINSLWQANENIVNLYWVKNSPLASHLFAQIENAINNNDSAQSYWEVINNKLISFSHKLKKNHYRQINRLIKDSAWRVGNSQKTQNNDNNLFPDARYVGIDVALVRLQQKLEEVTDINNISDEQKYALEKLILISQTISQLSQFSQTPHPIIIWVREWEKALTILAQEFIPQWQILANSLLVNNYVDKNILIDKFLWLHILNSEVDNYQKKYYQPSFGKNGYGIVIYPFIPEHITPAKINIVMGLSSHNFPKTPQREFFDLCEHYPDNNARQYERALAMIQIILNSQEFLGASFVCGLTQSPQLPSFVVRNLISLLSENKIAVEDLILPNFSEFNKNQEKSNHSKSPINKNYSNNYQQLWQIKSTDKINLLEKSKNKFVDVIQTLSDPVKFFTNRQLLRDNNLIEQELPQTPDIRNGKYEFSNLLENWLKAFAVEASKKNYVRSINSFCDKLADSGNFPYKIVGDFLVEKLINKVDQINSLLTEINLDINGLFFQSYDCLFAGYSIDFDSLILQTQTHKYQLLIYPDINPKSQWQIWIKHNFICSVSPQITLAIYEDNGDTKILKLPAKTAVAAKANLTKLCDLFQVSQKSLIPFHPNIASQLAKCARDSNSVDEINITKNIWLKAINFSEEDITICNIWKEGYQINEVLEKAKEINIFYWQELLEEFDEK